jgi:NAD(P)-dependent dehydrogenase (short-subunit alcohol dehydrogenase family)
MSKHSHGTVHDDATVPSRRGLLRGAGLATAAALAGTAMSRPATAQDGGVVPAPVYFPTRYTPEVSLHRKNIVVTGASRGIGRATALELVKAGANVWGTSRTPQAYPGITEYPLLELRLEDPASIAAFVPAIGVATRGRVNVLINNAGQFVFGTTTPIDPAIFGMWTTNSALALQVLYLGQRALTAAMLGLMQHTGYRRILFTASVTAYASGPDVVSEFYQPYVAGKRGIADFANSLRRWFSLIGLDIGVATVNPLATHTDGPLGLRPIFLEPVDGNGNPDPASPLAAVVSAVRAAIASAQPPRVVARAYRQLLELKNPHPNVIAGVSRGPLAEAGLLPLNLAARQKEMENGAMPWECGKSGHW